MKIYNEFDRTYLSTRDFVPNSYARTQRGNRLSTGIFTSIYIQSTLCFGNGKNNFVAKKTGETDGIGDATT